MNKFAEQFQNDVVIRYQQKMAALVKRAEEGDILTDTLDYLEKNPPDSSTSEGRQKAVNDVLNFQASHPDWEPEKLDSTTDTHENMWLMTPREVAEAAKFQKGNVFPVTVPGYMGYRNPPENEPVNMSFNGLRENIPQHAANVAANAGAGLPPGILHNSSQAFGSYASDPRYKGSIMDQMNNDLVPGGRFSDVILNQYANTPDKGLYPLVNKAVREAYGQ